ncbi:aldo/keto reductase [Segeticoccus rhizosphaerae]|jgi:D-threo-aldose 1-dehydrogenase|uniref:aldo/keto reductase n=1 Tax=Segeticoccus rhizosphaerae TaxID=1104777 RepID=UPI001264DE35|nr:aldo/keto reductase [Segeticoccus rhizosphaerae]
MPEFQLPRLSYGAANIGNLHRALTDDAAWELLETAWECGVRYFDTAPHYGLGLSERRLGAFLTTKPRDQFVLSTKVGRLLVPNDRGSDALDLAHDFIVSTHLRREWDFSTDGIRRSLEESLQRLALDRVDIAYLHDPERFGLAAALDTGVPAVTQLREEGLVTAVGIGSMSNEALLAGARTGCLDLLMVASRYTLTDQSAAEQVLPEAVSHGLPVVAAAVFMSGLLATDPPKADGLYEYGALPADVLERTRAIAQVCAQFGTDLPTAALQFPLRHPLVRTVVAGGATPEQVRQNWQRTVTPLPQDLWETLATAGLVTA